MLSLRSPKKLNNQLGSREAGNVFLYELWQLIFKEINVQK